MRSDRGQGDPAINQDAGHLNNDSHLSGSGRWGLINTRLTCPELRLACNSNHRSPPRCCLSLLHEVTGPLFPAWSPLWVHMAKSPGDERRKRGLGWGQTWEGKGAVRSRKKAPGFTDRERSADGATEKWAIHTPARDARVSWRVPDTPYPIILNEGISWTGTSKISNSFSTLFLVNTGNLKMK